MMVAQPQRLQTAMSLYSNNLSGIILLVDDRFHSYTGIQKGQITLDFKSWIYILKNTEILYFDLSSVL